MFLNGTKKITTRVLLVSLACVLMTLPHVPSMRWFSEEMINYASTSRDSTLRMFFPMCCCSDPCLPVGSQVVLCIGVFRCKILLWSVMTTHFRMSGETNSRTSSISRTRTKYCNPQIKRRWLASVLFYLRVSHPFIIRGRAEFHDPLNEVILLHISTTFLWANRAHEC